MPTDRFMIAPINSGLQTDLKPFLIPDDAFEKLTNAYIFRGRVVKRFGSLLMNRLLATEYAQLSSRLRVNIGHTPGPIALPNPGPGLAIGQIFSVGNSIFTVYQLGAGVATKSTDIGGATATINSAVAPNTITFAGIAAGLDVYFYPSLPVMGLITYEQSLINDEHIYAFDTRNAYWYVAGAWERLPAPFIWSGGNADFFQGCNYRGVLSSDYLLFVSNNVDPIRYWDTNIWVEPVITFAPGSTVRTARLIFSFKGRLLLLNTTETVGGITNVYRNRCRFSINGDPFSPNAWRQDISGKGDFIDAPTKQTIVSAMFLKDRIIVYFERSTWELAWTGNEVYPFRWQQINSELGVESTFSVVPFDQVAIGIGNTGIHACNGANVERIDDKIPDSVFEISNIGDGIFRVCGIRDYYSEMVYWAFPALVEGTYPGRVLVYNYKTGSWAFNEDSITAFGYYQNETTVTWNSTELTWEEAGMTWGSGQLQAKFRNVIAGNQEGYVFMISRDISRNCPALSITNVVTTAPNVTEITCIDHNLQANEYIFIESSYNDAALNDLVFQVQNVLSPNVFTIAVDHPAIYQGGGTVARVSNIDIQTKQYNFYGDKGRNSLINKVDFNVDSTWVGEVTVDYMISSSDISQLDDGAATGALVGTGTLELYPYALAPSENRQTRLWHPIYPMADGECIQLHIYLSPAQITTSAIAFSDFQLNAMIFYTLPTSSRLQ